MTRGVGLVKVMVVVVSATAPKIRTSVRSLVNPSGVETPSCLTIKAGGAVWANRVDADSISNTTTLCLNMGPVLSR